MKVRLLQEGRRGWAWAIAVPIVKPTLLATTKHRLDRRREDPGEGGCLLVLNHISHVDPLIAAHIVCDHGRMPRYLAKSGLFKNKALGFFFSAAGQIPVERRRQERHRCLSTQPSPPSAAASASSSTPRARSPATRTCGR